MTDPIEGERAVSAVSTKKSWFTPRRKAGLIVGATIVLCGFVFWKNPGQKKEDPDPPPPVNGMGQSVQYDIPKPQPMPIASSAPTQARTPDTASTPPPLEVPKPLPVPVPPDVAVKPVRKIRMLSYATEAPAGTGSGAGGVQPQTDTHVAFKPAEIAGAQAGPALDMDLMLMPGLVMCVLDVAINSTLPGPIMCHLDAPAKSPHNVTLMSRGTQIMGSYTSEIKQGQGRLMAVTATAYTPEGIPVPLGGTFSDALGRSGLGDVSIDNKYPERFGAAVLLTLGESALGIANSAVSKGGNSYVSLNAGGGVSSLAQEVLRSSINIPPEITKNQGDVIGLWILSPISFEKSYRLRSNQ